MNNIPDFVPNTDIAENQTSETITILNSSLNDIKIDSTKVQNCSIDSMACTGVNSIGDIKINL